MNTCALHVFYDGLLNTYWMHHEYTLIISVFTRIYRHTESQEMCVVFQGVFDVYSGVSFRAFRYSQNIVWIWSEYMANTYILIRNPQILIRNPPPPEPSAGTRPCLWDELLACRFCRSLPSVCRVSPVGDHPWFCACLDEQYCQRLHVPPRRLFSTCAVRKSVWW